MLSYVKKANIKFTRTPTKRAKTEGMVLHHPAVYEYSPEALHRGHLSRGWLGAGYNFYVRKDGTVYELRGRDAIGAHAGSKVAGIGLDNNSSTIGISFEGMYHPSTTQKIDINMPKAQFDAGVRLINDLLKMYPSIKYIKGHKEMPGTSTACPGNYFPLNEFKSLIKGGSQMAVYRRGSKGSGVKKLQGDLIKLGYSVGSTGADGSYGPATEKAVKAFQKDSKISIDGIAGPDTQNHIKSALNRKTLSTAEERLKKAQDYAKKILDL